MTRLLQEEHLTDFTPQGHWDSSGPPREIPTAPENRVGPGWILIVVFTDPLLRPTMTIIQWSSKVEEQNIHILLLLVVVVVVVEREMTGMGMGMGMDMDITGPDEVPHMQEKKKNRPSR